MARNLSFVVTFNGTNLKRNDIIFVARSATPTAVCLSGLHRACQMAINDPNAWRHQAAQVVMSNAPHRRSACDEISSMRIRRARICHSALAVCSCVMASVEGMYLLADQKAASKMVSNQS